MKFKKERNSIRLEPKELMEYYALLLIESKKINGHFRNISETGFNFIREDDSQYSDLIGTGQKVEGILGWAKTIETLDFAGSIKWVRTLKMHDQSFVVAGIKFDNGFILPEYFYKMTEMND